MIRQFSSIVMQALPPSIASRLLLSNLDWFTTLGWHTKISPTGPEVPASVMGLRFPNPIGLCSGVDIHGKCVSAFGALGFGFIEVGPVALRPRIQSQDYSWRRLRKREGFAKTGSGPLADVGTLPTHLKSAQAFRLRGGILGIALSAPTSVGSSNALSDALLSYSQAFDLADYFALSFVDAAQLDPVAIEGVIHAFAQKRAELIQSHPQKAKPLIIHIPLTVSDNTAKGILSAAHLAGLDGISLIDGIAEGDGLTKLYGRPSFARALKLTSELRNLCTDRFALIVSGCITTPSDAIQLHEAGANLVQIDSGLFLHGPDLIYRTLLALNKDRADMPT